MVSKTGETVWTRYNLYKVVVQLVMLYDSKSLAVTGEMLKVLEVFNNWLARRIMGMTAEYTTGGIWSALQCLNHWRPLGDGKSRIIYRAFRTAYRYRWPDIPHMNCGWGRK